MEQSFSDLTTKIYIARLRQWPEADTKNLVRDSVQAAELIIKRCGGETLRDLYHNLQLDYKALESRYQSALLQLGERAVVLTKESVHDMAGK